MANIATETWARVKDLIKNARYQSQAILNDLIHPWFWLSENSFQENLTKFIRDVTQPFKSIHRSYQKDNNDFDTAVLKKDGKTTFAADIRELFNAMVPVVGLPFIVLQNSLHVLWWSAALLSTSLTWLFNYNLINRRAFSDTWGTLKQNLIEIAYDLTLFSSAVLNVVFTLCIRLPIRLTISAWEAMEHFIHSPKDTESFKPEDLRSSRSDNTTKIQLDGPKPSHTADTSQTLEDPLTYNGANNHGI